MCVYIYTYTYMFIYTFIMNTSPYYPEEVELLGCSQTKQSQYKPFKGELPKPLCPRKLFVKQVNPKSSENHCPIDKHSRIGKP